MNARIGRRYPAPPKTPAQREVERAERESLEVGLLTLLRHEGLPEPRRQVRWHPSRAWVADAGYIDRIPPVLIEVEGWGHKVSRRFEEDVERYNEMQLMGYRLIRVTSRTLRDGRAVRWIARALGEEGSNGAE